jgi:hypothetical protein
MISLLTSIARNPATSLGARHATGIAVLSEKRPLLLPLRLLLACRIALFPKYYRKYLQLDIWRKLLSDKHEHDPLYFLQHRHHLSKRFTLRQRIANAITHHQYESENYISSYERKVYQADGICLWECKVGDHYFRITLTGSESNRNEGELNVILSGDGNNLWRTSFSYVCGGSFFLTKRVFLLVSRNQAESPEKDIFYECFGQNQPQLFCLSAVCGIALANGWDTILAIRHDHQIAYNKTLHRGFYNSYTHLWKQFDAREIDSHVFELAAPLKVRPLNTISRPHRARARTRREYWSDICRKAQTTLADYRRHEGSAS